MKKAIILGLLFISSIISIHAQNWLTDIEEAKTSAAKENRNIILVFQGSDWCAPCMKLEKEIWNTDEFKEYSKEHFILLKADFPRKRKNKLESVQQEKNMQLAEKYNKQGFFPMVVVLDKEGNVLGRTGYEKMEVSEYIKLLESF
ncbi:MAG: thioredoxin family protein [Chlorobi bacterium]|nr:thioredoxin family protein [Chlorobiota bacterium]